MASKNMYGLLGSNPYQNPTISVKPHVGNTEGSLSDPVETTRWLPIRDEDIVLTISNNGLKKYN